MRAILLRYHFAYLYNKYVALAREKKVPFGYLHATNVDAGIREMATTVLRK